jgi:hypothetical protein
VEGMYENLVEQSIVFNELYMKRVSGIETNKVDSIIKNSLTKKKAKLAQKFEFPKLSDLSQAERVKLERRHPEDYQYADRDTGIITRYNRTIKTADGVTLILYFDSAKDLHFMHVLVRNKSNNKMTTKRLFWRLHSKKSTVNHESFISFEEDAELEFDEVMELVESTLLLSDM